jgi:putative membrane protein
MSRHTKWPTFMRMHGSILPKMILPLLFVGGWATFITCISFFVHDLGISSLLLTITGFVVSLGLSFRSSTAYERYNEGRKYWTQLILASQSLSRVIWVHGAERWDDEHKLGKQDLLGKMTALNLITAFSVGLKHKLRFEPYTGYEDLHGLIGHLDTFAKAATKEDSCIPRKVNFFKSVGTHLGVSFAESNPRKALKKSSKPLGNLPLEILTYLAAYIDETVEEGKLKIPMQQTMACKCTYDGRIMCSQADHHR